MIIAGGLLRGVVAPSVGAESFGRLILRYADAGGGPKEIDPTARTQRV
jgi:hypothetical protein